MATYNQMQVQQKPKFSVAITTKGYQSLISNTLRDPARARRFTASITSRWPSTPPAGMRCRHDSGRCLLGESLNLSRPLSWGSTTSCLSSRKPSMTATTG